METAQNKWRRLRGYKLLAEMVEGTLKGKEYLHESRVMGMGYGRDGSKPAFATGICWCAGNVVPTRLRTLMFSNADASTYMTK